MKLSEAFHAASATLFPKVEGERQPDYKGLFVEVVSAILDARKVKYDKGTVQKIADHVNLSSFQRGAAAEAATRYGKMEANGSRGEVVKKAPKAKKTGVAAIDGIKRKKDPITGETVKKAAKTPKKAPKVKSTKKPAKEAAAPTKLVKTGTKGKVIAEKAVKPAGPADKTSKKAPTKPAKVSKGEIDPITGEAV